MTRRSCLAAPVTIILAMVVAGCPPTYETNPAIDSIHLMHQHRKQFESMSPEMQATMRPLLDEERAALNAYDDAVVAHDNDAWQAAKKRLSDAVSAFDRKAAQQR